MLCSISNVMISTEIAFLPSVARSNEKRISLPAEEYSEKKIYRNDIKLAQPKQHNHHLDVIPADAGIQVPISLSQKGTQKSKHGFLLKNTSEEFHGQE